MTIWCHFSPSDPASQILTFICSGMLSLTFLIPKFESFFSFFFHPCQGVESRGPFKCSVCQPTSLVPHYSELPDKTLWTMLFCSSYWTMCQMLVTSSKRKLLHNMWFILLIVVLCLCFSQDTRYFLEPGISSVSVKECFAWRLCALSPACQLANPDVSWQVLHVSWQMNINRICKTQKHANIF